MPSSPTDTARYACRSQREDTFAIDSGKDLILAESIYNCYTGIGGLHNLKQSDFASYHEYAEAKKEFEMGQFFTSYEICRDMVDMLCPVSSEMDSWHVLRYGQFLQTICPTRIVPTAST